MGPLYTAIIHLREPATPLVRRIVLPALGSVPGVDDAEYDPIDGLVAITFDGERARLPDLVRLIEDLGPAVAGVAQRSAALRPVPRQWKRSGADLSYH